MLPHTTTKTQNYHKHAEQSQNDKELRVKTMQMTKKTHKMQTVTIRQKMATESQNNQEQNKTHKTTTLTHIMGIRQKPLNHIIPKFPVR